MSIADRTSVFTGKLFELQSALENGYKKTFVKKFKEHSLSLHNTSCGDSFLGEQYNKVLRKALEKFII
jgi:hypothetical protein